MLLILLLFQRILSPQEFFPFILVENEERELNETKAVVRILTRLLIFQFCNLIS